MQFWMTDLKTDMTWIKQHWYCGVAADRMGFNGPRNQPLVH